MTHNFRLALVVFSVIAAAMWLSACGLIKSAPAPVLPPVVIKVPSYMPLPAECKALQPVDLPPGTTAQDLIAKQAAAILAYESEVKRCFTATPPAP